MDRFNPPSAEPTLTREQDAKAYEIAVARKVAAAMREAFGDGDNWTDLGAMVEDFAARLEVAADNIEQDNNLPTGPRQMKALGDYLMGAE